MQNDQNSPAQVQTLRAFLESRFAPCHVIEFRAIRTGRVRRFWTKLSELATVEVSLRRLDESDWDVYAGVNPRCEHRSDERAVRTLVAFHVDVDNASDVGDRVRSAHEKHTGEIPPAAGAARPVDTCESVLARSAHRESAIPQPSLIVDSGRGRHCYWILSEPIAVTAANRERLKAINRGLALALGGDTACCDLARILRVPTFHNHKRDPIKKVSVLAATGVRYTLEDFATLAVESGAVRAGDFFPESLSARSAHTVPVLTPELAERFRTIRKSDESVQAAWRGELGDGSSDSRYALVQRLRREFTPDEIVAIVCSRRWFNRRSKKVRHPSAVLRDTRRLVGSVRKLAEGKLISLSA